MGALIIALLIAFGVINSSEEMKGFNGNVFEKNRYINETILKQYNQIAETIAFDDNDVN